MISISLGYSLTETEAGSYQSLPLSCSFRPWPWLLVNGSLPVSIISATETYDDEILVGGVPTPRETTLSYSTAGIGDATLSVWADVGHVARLLFSSNPAPVDAPAPDG